MGPNGPMERVALPLSTLGTSESTLASSWQTAVEIQHFGTNDFEVFGETNRKYPPSFCIPKRRPLCSNEGRKSLGQQVPPAFAEAFSSTQSSEFGSPGPVPGSANCSGEAICASLVRF